MYAFQDFFADVFLNLGSTLEAHHKYVKFSKGIIKWNHDSNSVLYASSQSTIDSIIKILLLKTE